MFNEVDTKISLELGSWNNFARMCVKYTVKETVIVSHYSLMNKYIITLI